MKYQHIVDQINENRRIDEFDRKHTPHVFVLIVLLLALAFTVQF